VDEKMISTLLLMWGRFAIISSALLLLLLALKGAK
jgi:hypothetical protein